MKKRHLVRLTAWVTALSMAFSMAGNVVGVSALTSDNNDNNPTIVYADSEDETPEDEIPEDEIPEDETPEDETPENETPEDETPENETPEDETPEDETPEIEIPATPEPIITHYVQEVSGEGLIPYEYYSIDYGDAEIDDGAESCVYARSYNYNKSIYSSLDGYNALTAEEKQIYSSLYEALETIDNSAAYDAEYDDYFGDYYFPLMKIANKEVDADTLFKVYLAVSDDNPQFFWKGHGYYRSVSSTSTSIAILLDPKCVDYRDGAARMAVKEELMSTVDSVLVQAERFGNDYSREWYIHNYLCEVNTYDLTGPHAHDITGVLLDGRGVCESYAKCFQMFMNALDIDVLYVTGTANGGGHAWNQIALDGEWYNVDVTWDDNKSGGWNYYYFNVVDSDGSLYDFIKGYGGYNYHTALKNGDREYVYPTNKCTATKYAYKNHETNFADPSAVAHVGKNYFDTLDDAIASIKTTGKTIELLNNAEYNGTTMPAYPFTIECNGFSIAFNDDMILKSNVTIKNISGPESSPESISSIIVGAYTLDIGVQPTSVNKSIPVNISGGTTPKGTVNITSQGYIGFDSVENISKLNLCENAVLCGTNGLSCTNLILNKNSLVRTTFNEIHVTNLTAKELSQIYIASNDPSYNTKVIIDGTAMLDDSFKVCVGEVSYANGVPLLITKNKYPSAYFNVSFNSDDTPVPLKRTLSDGMYCYTPVDHPDFSIYNSGGICIEETASVGEALEYIDSLAKTTETYTVYYTGSDAFITVDSSDLSVSKAKEVIFAGAPYEINNALTLKTNLTFKSGATFKGELSTGTFALTLDSANPEIKEEYCIYPTTKSPNIVVRNSKLNLCGGEETASKTGKVTLVNTEATCSKLLTVLSLDITDSSIEFSGDDCLATIGSIKSTGDNIISLSGNPSITLTGTVTLTDSKPIEINPVGNTAENGATVITAANTAVKSAMFKTTAKTPCGLDLNIIRNDKKIQFAVAVFELKKGIDTLGTYSVWSDVVAAINAENDAQATYCVMLLDNAQVKTLTLPAATKCKSITFDSLSDITLSVENDITLATDTYFNVKLRKVDALTEDEKPLNFTISSKELTLKSINKIGNISGTGIVNIGDAKISGAVNAGELIIQGKVTLVENASLTVKSISQSNPTDRLVYPYQNASKIKIGGIEGTLVIEMTDGDSEYSYPTNKPFDLFNVTTGFSGGVKIVGRDDFKYVVSGTKMVAINGDSTYHLYLKDDETDTYDEICECISYKDTITIINSRNKPTAEYMIVLPYDESFTGALPLPAAGKYKSLYLSSPSVDDNITVSVTSDLTLTGDLVLAEEVLLKKVDTKGNEVNLNINLGKYSFYLSQIGKIGNITGTTGTIDLLDAEIFGKVNVKNFISYGTVALDKNATFTATTVSGDAVFEYPYTSASKINIGTIDGDIVVILKDGSGVYDYPENAPFDIMNIKNDYVQDSVTIFDKGDYSVVRSGTKLVAGKTDKMFILNDGSDNSLFTNLKDIMTEINRLNKPSASYTITVPSDMKVTGVLPLPAAKKYDTVYFNGTDSNPVTLSLTGDINLTGHLNFGEYITVKKVNASDVELPLNIKLGSYWFTAKNIGQIGNVSGLNSSAVFFDDAEVYGTINVGTVCIRNRMTLLGRAALTAKEGVFSIDASIPVLSYNYQSASKINIKEAYGIVIRLTDGETDYAYPEGQSVNVMNITGEYDDGDMEIYNRSDIKIVRSGNKLVAAKTDGLYVLGYDNGVSYTESKFISLKDIMTEINRRNNPDGNYLVKLPADENITGALPLPTARKYKEIAFDSKEHGTVVTISVTSDLTLTGNLRICDYATIRKVDRNGNELPINLNVGAYSLSAMNIGDINNITAANGKVWFESENTNISGTANIGTLQCSKTITLGDRAAFTVNEYRATQAGAKLIYPYKNVSKIKIGTVSDKPVTIKMTDGDGDYVYPESNFDILNITGDYYDGDMVIDGCSDHDIIRSGNKLIAFKDADIIVLNDGNGHNTSFINLKDIMTDINRINELAKYSVEIPSDMEIKGALPLPAANKYYLISFEGKDSNDVTISLTSDISLTGNILFQNGAAVKKVNATTRAEVPLNINLGKYGLYAEEIGKIGSIRGSNNSSIDLSFADISGTISVDKLHFGNKVTLGNSASLTAKYLFSENGILEYPYKNAAKIKTGTVVGTVEVRMTDGENEYAYPTDRTFDVMNITGDFATDSVVINGNADIKVMRSGNKLVAGKDVKKYILETSSGNAFFASLKDIMTEINRINNPEASYTVTLPASEHITGALPLPTAKKYKQIRFTSAENVDLSLTGDITLTGNVTFGDTVFVEKVNATTRAEVPLNINLGTYEMSVFYIGEIGRISGAAGKVNFLRDVKVSGTVNVGTISVGGRMALENNASLTAANVFTTESGILDYKLKNASRVRINISDCLNIKLLDDNGTPVTLDETYANKVLIGKYTGNLGNVHIEGNIPEGYVLEKTSTNAVILKKKLQ